MIQIWIVTIFVSLLVFVCYVDLSLSSTMMRVGCGCAISVAPFSTVCYDRYFFSTDLALFLECILSYCDNPITRYTIFYLFSHEISISLMLSQPSFNFRAVHGYAFFLLFHSDASRITHVMLPFYNTAYLISEPTAQGLGFTLCIQYR